MRVVWLQGQPPARYAVDLGPNPLLATVDLRRAQMCRNPDEREHRGRPQPASARDGVRAVRLKLILADAVVLLVVLTVLPMLWVGDYLLRLWGGLRQWTKRR
jgi:hypothetical protein